MSKVCIITVVHKHDDVRIYHKEAKTLNKAGYDVIILCPDYEGKDEDGIRFVMMNIPKERKRRLIQSGNIAYNAAICIDADIYHIHDPELLPICLKLVKKGKKVIYDAHEDFMKSIMSKEWIFTTIRKPLSKYLGQYEVKTAHKLSGVIVSTQDIAMRFKNAVVVYNYPVIEEILHRDKPKPYPLRNNNICYVGALTATRGVIQMVRCMREVDGKLVLAGEFESTELKLLVHKLPEYEKVDYKGCLDRDGIWDVLYSSKIGLLLLSDTPSYIESVPIKLFEYMLAGLPVIASDFVKWKELIGSGACVYVDPNNTELIAQEIDRILKAPDVAIKMGEEGKRLVMERFNFKEEAVKLLRLYEKVLNTDK